jgi:hypothetical protein
VLTNSDDHDLQVNLALSILRDLVAEPGIYHDRLASLRPRPPVLEPQWLRLPGDMADLVAGAAMPPAADQADRWAGYVGAYRAPDCDVLDPVDPGRVSRLVRLTRLARPVPGGDVGRQTSQVFRCQAAVVLWWLQAVCSS